MLLHLQGIEAMTLKKKRSHATTKVKREPRTPINRFLKFRVSRVKKENIIYYNNLNWSVLPDVACDETGPVLAQSLTQNPDSCIPVTHISPRPCHGLLSVWT